MANYLSYWTLKNAHHDYDGGHDFSAAWNSRYNKVKSGDVIWLVTVEDERLILLGSGIAQEDAVPQSQVKNHPFFQKAKGLEWATEWEPESSWEKYWIIIKNPKPLSWIDITSLSSQLRFESKSNPLMYENPAKWGNALQTLRTLTPESAQLLQARLLGGTVPVEIAETLETPYGAGFGDPISNREVEKAAIDFVTTHYSTLGWKVTSKEREKCGYDLLCENNQEIHHVEVKGVKGSIESVILTKNEVSYLDRPESFVCLVTSALSSPKLTSYSGEEFKKHFKLEPYAFMAAKVLTQSE